MVKEARFNARAKLAASALIVVWWTALAAAQDLAPRAYIITPVHANAITLTWSFYDGGLNFNGTVPITGATGKYHVPVLSYYHSLNFFGHSANLTVSLPYAVGNFSGNVLGNGVSVYRSGLMDLSARFSVNLLGGPAMGPQEFAKWKQKRILGASLKIVAPTGQYDPTKLINWGINRWAFKPELGYSQRWGKWQLDAYGGVWFYTENPQSFHVPFPVPQTQAPVGSFEGHFSRDLGKLMGHKTRAWVSLDGNFWHGGDRFGIRDSESQDDAVQFEDRWHRLCAVLQTPVHQSWVQRRQLQPFRRLLPEPASGMAVLVGREALVGGPRSVPIFHMCRTPPIPQTRVLSVVACFRQLKRT